MLYEPRFIDQKLFTLWFQLFPVYVKHFEYDANGKLVVVTELR